MIERYPDSVSVSLAYAKRLLPLGHLVRACNLLLPFADVFPEGNWRRLLVDKTLSLFALLSRLEEAPLQEDQDARMLAMKHMILHFRDRELPARDSSGLGRLTLITGSLGPGGAERQLSRLAIELERARKNDGEIAGVPLDRPVEVLVRSHGPEKQNDFFLEEIQASGCELGQIDLFKPLSNKALAVDDPVLSKLIDYLPSPVNYGVRRLTQHFQESGTETASIWQDGACLFGGLAALMAGVPHIQLAMRGLPPSMRRHLYRPEYEVLYRAMAEVPGVSFVSNNLAAARAYAEWLEFPVSRFGIVYNGVEPMRAQPSTECAELWHQFVESTPDAEHTIGGVFRLDTDKQPLLWIRFAARYLRRHPASRFVLVGGGRLLPNARELAEKLGISDRILFVGRSTRVGYWMSKMDVLVLMSRYEGLPNVLIEAQYMGVRVVTTPAGGAAECLIDGTTGFVLECAEKPNLEHAVDRAHGLALRSDDRELFAEGGVGRTFLDSHFSIPRMLEEYVSCTVERLRVLDPKATSKTVAKLLERMPIVMQGTRDSWIARWPLVRGLAVAVIAIAAAACSGMPRAVSSLSEVQEASKQGTITLSAGDAGNTPPAPVLLGGFPASFMPAGGVRLRAFGSGRPPVRSHLGKRHADRIRRRGRIEFGEMTVDGEGRLYLPYVGAIRVSGLTATEVRDGVIRRLRTVILRPQVDVRVVDRRSTLVTVQGDAAKTGTYSIERGRTRLGSLLAEVAPSQKNPEMLKVTVRRDGEVGQVRLSDIYKDPALDIALKPGDSIILNEVIENITVLGAAGVQGQVKIPERNFTVVDALGQARGLNPEAADPRGVFVMRAQEQPGTAPLVYQFDMRRPEAIALANRFVLRDEDAVLISNASWAQTRQVIAAFAQGMASVRSAATVPVP